MAMQSDKLRKVLSDMQELPSFVGVRLDGPNVRGNFGETPLHVAAIQGDAGAIRALAAAGADLGARGEHGYTPLHEAVEQGHVEIVKLLLELGSPTDQLDDEGNSAMKLARIIGNGAIAAIFEQRG